MKNANDQIKENTQLFHEANEVYSQPVQIAVAIEEFAELCVLLSRILRNRPVSILDLASEIADAMIMASQMRLLEPEMVDEAVAKKLARLQGRIIEAQNVKKG